MEDMLQTVFIILGFTCLLIALIYELQEKKSTKKFIETVESDYKKFLATGEDYHFLDQEKKKMKIQKGHYVPKELITSEALHEAVVKCFVEAGFIDDGRGKYKDSSSWNGLRVDDLGFICWSLGPANNLTLQQLFTAENGLQWPDWAVDIRTDDHCVWLDGVGRADVISGDWSPVKSRVLATRQPKENEFPPAGAYCQFLLTDGSNKWVNCFVIGVDDLGFCVCRADMDYFASMSPASFRPVEPIKSECQKFIESAIDASVIDNGIPVAVVPYLNEVFERMFHAGFKSPDKLIGDLESAKNAAYMALKDIDCRDWRGAVQALVNADLLKFKDQ